ncbi:MAG TPA: hypothetical protein VFF16_17680, partial [Telluria sp.]|nr:hypothetical protein [Telluria sp.]
RRRPVPLNEWFFVEFDENLVTMRANPPGREAPYASDGIYGSTAGRQQPAIRMESTIREGE